jgi:predicted GNAT family acetyltransferase
MGVPHFATQHDWNVRYRTSVRNVICSLLPDSLALCILVGRQWNSIAPSPGTNSVSGRPAYTRGHNSLPSLKTRIDGGPRQTNERSHSRSCRVSFEFPIDGGDIAAAYYRVGHDRLVLIHTEVPNQFTGQRIGTRLACGVLDAIRASGDKSPCAARSQVTTIHAIPNIPIS